MAEKMRVGVIGVGQIGKAHVDRYTRVPDAEMVAVADINEAEAQRVAKQHGIPHAYGDFRELLARDDIADILMALGARKARRSPSIADRPGAARCRLLCPP
jgi:predicted dehydrogenase